MLDDWAIKWGCYNPLALQELRALLSWDAVQAMPVIEINPDDKPGSESRQQSLVRLAAADAGVWLTRNNVGALLDDRGVPVRYGLCNESKSQNEAVKSADTIGMYQRTIRPQDVGKVFAQFVSVELKEQVWKFNPKDKHEVAQMAWCNFVNSKGGIGMFANGPEMFRQQLRGFTA